MEAELSLAHHVARKAKIVAVEAGGRETDIEVLIFDRAGTLVGRSDE